MDDLEHLEHAATGLGAFSTLLLLVLAWVRRRRRAGKSLLGSFRPRARVRAYISMRTHKRSEASPQSLEPGPFEEERDTGKHHRMPDDET